MIITLDGPCYSGKSTLAQLLAVKLGFFYINSGYLYRSVAYILITEFGYDDEKLYNPDFDTVNFILHKNNLRYEYLDGVAQVFFKDQEITQYLKHSTVSHAASIIAAHQNVRELIVPLQQYFGRKYNIVTDGRDCGTEIYPQAQFKFYVTALPEIRAQRLHADLEKNNIIISFEQALQMTLSRDKRDMTRVISPLKKAHDGIEIDTSYQSIHQILDFLVSAVQE